jgi:hypothetical protein
MMVSSVRSMSNVAAVTIVHPQNMTASVRRSKLLQNLTKSGPAHVKAKAAL